MSLADKERRGWVRRWKEDRKAVGSCRRDMDIKAHWYPNSYNGTLSSGLVAETYGRDAKERLVAVVKASAFYS